MSDFDDVLEEIRNLPVGQEISDGAARTIASWYNDGSSTEIYSFVSTGAIATKDLWWIITDHGELYEGGSAEEKLCLDYLGTYLLNRGAEPVEGWSELWVS